MLKNSLNTKPIQVSSLKVAMSDSSPHLSKERSEEEFQGAENLLNQMQLENERLKKLLESQFRLSHAFDFPYHVERKWAQYKIKNLL
jgi:hypothetical protein